MPKFWPNFFPVQTIGKCADNEAQYKKGTLTLGSIYKLIAIAWSVTWLTIYCLMRLSMGLFIVFNGGTGVFGDIIFEPALDLREMLLMLFLFPVLIVLQSFWFAALFTGGVWLYKLKNRWFWFFRNNNFDNIVALADLNQRTY